MRKSELNVCGVYSITSPSGGVYIGSAVLVRRRWHQHKITLRGQKHKNPTLQNAWNKYGEEQMTFSLLLIYFNGAFGRVRAGDIIHVTDDDGSRIYCVTTAASPNNVIINGPVETL